MSSDKKGNNLGVFSFCSKCQLKSQDLIKIYELEIKNLNFLLNFKDMAVRKRDEMILKYVEDIHKLKETINNLNKLIFRLKSQIPDPKNLTLFQNNPPYISKISENYEIDLSSINNQASTRPNSSYPAIQKRNFSATIINKNKIKPNVRLAPKDNKICVTQNQGLPKQQGLLSDRNRKTIALMEEGEEIKFLKDPKIKQLEDFYQKNENYLEAFMSLKPSARSELLDNSYSILRDFKISLSHSLKFKTIIRFFQKLVKNSSYQDIFFLITKYTADILECEKSTLFLIDEENQELWTKFKVDDKDVFRIPLDHGGIIGYVASNNVSIRVDDTAIDPRYNKDIDNFEHNYHLKTILAIPVKDLDGQAIGVLEAFNKIHNIFTNEDEEFINLISQQTHSVLKNSNNNEKIMRNQYKLEELIEFQTKLYQIENYEDFQLAIEKSILNFTKSSEANIFLVENSQKIVLKLKHKKEQNEKYPLNIGVIGEAIKRGEEIFSTSIQNHPNFNSSIDINSNLPIHTYPIKNSNGNVLLVVQTLKYNEILGRKNKKDPHEEQTLRMFFNFLAAFYDKIKDNFASNSVN